MLARHAGTLDSTRHVRKTGIFAGLVWHANRLSPRHVRAMTRCPSKCDLATWLGAHRRHSGVHRAAYTLGPTASSRVPRWRPSVRGALGALTVSGSSWHSGSSRNSSRTHDHVPRQEVAECRALCSRWPFASTHRPYQTPDAVLRHVVLSFVFGFLLGDADRWRRT